MNIQNSFILILLFASSLNAFSQSIDVAGNVHLNPYLENPAAISEADSIQINIRNSHFSRYYNYEPNFSIASDILFTPDNKNSSFMLGYNFTSSFKNHKSHSVMLGYAYKYLFNESSSLSMGIWVSGSDYNKNYTYEVITGSFVGSPSIDKIKGNILSATPGLMLNVNNLRFSIRSTLCYFDTYQFNYVNQEEQTMEQKPYWLSGSAMVSYGINLSSKFQLAPYFRILTNNYKQVNLLNSNYSWDIDMGSAIQLKDFMRAGLGLTLYDFISDKMYAFSSFRVFEFMELSALASYRISQLSGEPPFSFSGQVSIHL